MGTRREVEVGGLCERQNSDSTFHDTIMTNDTPVCGYGFKWLRGRWEKNDLDHLP